MTYTLDAIKKKMNDLSSGSRNNRNNNNKGPRLTFWKPTPTEPDKPHRIRFLPYQDQNEQPFQEVSYYDNKELTDRRIIAPAQFDLDDPVFELLAQLKKMKSKNAWNIMNSLRAKERYYAPILVRGEEDKGVQIWELNTKLLKDIYGWLAHEDYADEDLMDPVNGYDWKLTVTETDREFMGYKVKEYHILPDRKPKKLFDKKEDREKILSQVPDLYDHFKQRVPNADLIKGKLEEFLVEKQAESSITGALEETSGDSSSDEESFNFGHNSSSTNASSSESESPEDNSSNNNNEDEELVGEENNKHVDDIDSAFSDLEDD